MPAPLVNAGKDGNVCPEIEKHIELHGRMAALPPRPREKCQAQLDQRRIQREQSERQIRLWRLTGVQTLSSAHQNRCHFRKHAPISVGVRVCQIATLHSPADAGVVKQLAPRFQARLDVAQALPIRQLCKYHRREVIVCGNCGRRPTHRMASRAARELLRVQTSENLRQHRRSVAHRAKMASQGPAKTLIEDTS